MSSRPWKNTNSRSNTNNTDIIHCDELFVDDLLATNATLRNVTITKEVTTNTFDVSNISISNNINVPDVSVNTIGEMNTNKNVEFISPFSAPFGLISKIRAYDSSFTTIRVNDVSLNRISNIDNDAVVIISDVSFNQNITANTALIRDIHTDTSFIIHSDVSCNQGIYANDISLEYLSHHNSDGIIEITGDISANKITIKENLDVKNKLDTSFITLNVIENNGSSSIQFTNNTRIDGSASIHDLCLNSFEHDITTFNSDVKIENKTVEIQGDISLNTLVINNGRFNGDVSFLSVSVENTSVNTFKNNGENKIVIDSDVSINNTTVFKGKIGDSDVNFMNKYELGDVGSNTLKKRNARLGTIIYVNKNQKFDQILFKNYRKTYSALEINPKNVVIDMKNIKLYDNSYNSNEYQFRDFSLNHEA